jgi:FtsP/CotA-like multicopper oxidase with cupredoxin domain
VSDSEAPSPDRQISRREALKRVGGGGLTVLGAGMVVGAVGSHAVADAAAADTVGGASGDYDTSPRRLSADSPTGAQAGPYGSEFSVPDEIAEGDLDALTRPPVRASGSVEVEMTVVERTIQVARGHTVDAWTYNGTAPGPIIRATEGELIRVHFSNNTSHDHNLHFHGKHSPLHDGWEPIPPGGETVYEIEAGPAGVHPYHCHTMPIDRHIAKGLYGTLIVDPPRGRPDAHEVVLALSGWDVNDDGRNELYAWNGLAGHFLKYPIKLPAGEPVRAYVLNMTEFDPIASFHLHAETFAVYPAGMGNAPAFHGDVVSFGQMDRAILEFTLSERGRYMFHPHQHSMAGRGAMGWFAAI